MKTLRKLLFALIVCLLVLALAFTIFGSSAGHDGLLGAGSAMWLAASALAFTWVVMVVWSMVKRYGK